MRRLLLLFAMAVSMVAGAQDKLSLQTRMFLANKEAQTSTVKNGVIKRAGTIVSQQNGTEMVSSLIRLNDGTSLDSLKALGVVVQNKFGKVYTVMIPADKLVAVSELTDVQHVSVAQQMRLKNDSARAYSNVDPVQAGTGLDKTYTGKDVIVGIVDDGFDFQHINFKDANGKTRIKMIYNGADMHTDADYIGRVTTDDKSESHASHVTGIAAGHYSGNQLQGMAPDADLALAEMGDGQDTQILNGMAAIFHYADSVGKPAVINMSLGNNAGPLDGTTDFDLALDNVVKAGRLVCMSSGNEADSKLSICKKFENASGQMQFKTIASMSSGTDSYNVDLWNNSANAVAIQYAILDGNNKVLTKTDKITPVTDVWQLSKSTYATAFGKYFGGDIESKAGVRKANNRFEHFVYITEKSGAHMTQYQLAMYVYGTQGDSICMRGNNGDIQFINNNDDSFTVGNGDCSLNSFATTSNVITVGSYDTKNYFKLAGDLRKHTYSYISTIGDISKFSSYGVDYNGVSHPDIVAPGKFLLSSYNRYDTESIKVAAKTYGTGTDECYWGPMMGTSMACPVVTGIVALWLQYNPNLTPADLRKVFKATSKRDAFVTNEDAVKWGAGKIDAYAGLQYLMQQDPAGISTANLPQYQTLIYGTGEYGRYHVYAQGESVVNIYVYSATGVLEYSSKVNTTNGETILDLNGKVMPGIHVLKVKGAAVNASEKIAM